MGEHLGPYVAQRNLLIPQGPGVIPSSMRIPAGTIFSFDGDEPIDIAMLRQQGVIVPYLGPIPEAAPDSPIQLPPAGPRRRGGK
mgnify:CR=1 FL=1